MGGDLLLSDTIFEGVKELRKNMDRGDQYCTKYSSSVYRGAGLSAAFHDINKFICAQFNHNIYL